MIPMLSIAVLAVWPAAGAAPLGERGQSRRSAPMSEADSDAAGIEADRLGPAARIPAACTIRATALWGTDGLGAARGGAESEGPDGPGGEGPKAGADGRDSGPTAQQAPSADAAGLRGDAGALAPKTPSEERWPAWALAASPHLTAWNAERLRAQRIAMGVLGGWAIANLVVGVAGALADADPRRRSLYLGSAAWNVVNLAIAAFSLRDAFRADPTRFDLQASQREGDGLAKALLINMGLDAAYLAAAAFLWQRGEAVGDPRLVGLGQALLLQGAFLAVFDTAFFLVVNRHLQGLWLSPIVAPNAVGLSLAGAL
jgi:hypothetical protein